jgi:hypothetical protein
MTKQTAETNILFAVLSQDYDEAREIIADLLPGEKRGLRKALNKTEEILDEFDEEN